MNRRCHVEKPEGRISVWRRIYGIKLRRNHRYTENQINGVTGESQIIMRQIVN